MQPLLDTFRDSLTGLLCNDILNKSTQGFYFCFESWDLTELQLVLMWLNKFPGLSDFTSNFHTCAFKCKHLKQQQNTETAHINVSYV